VRFLDEDDADHISTSAPRRRLLGRQVEGAGDVSSGPTGLGGGVRRGQSDSRFLPPPSLPESPPHRGLSVENHRDSHSTARDGPRVARVRKSNSSAD